MSTAILSRSQPDQLELLYVRPLKIRYPLEIEESYYSECDIGSYFSKGHHPVDKFTAAVAAHMDYYGAELLGFFGDKPLGPQVKHLFWRTVPDAEMEIRYVETQPGRGAFPVTVIELLG